MILLVSSLEIVHVVLPDANIFLWINASVADTAVASNNDIKTLLPNGFSTFLIKDKPVFSDGPKYLLRNHLLRLPYFVQLSLLLFATLESSTTFDESFKLISVPLCANEFLIILY